MIRLLILLIFILALGAGIFNFYPEIINYISHFQAEEEVQFDQQLIEENPSAQLEEEEDLTFEELINKGNNFLDKGFLTLAINNFISAVKISPHNKKAREMLIKTQITAKDFDAAENTIENSLKFFPFDKDFLIFLGEVYLQKTEIERAKATFNQLSDIPEKFFFLGSIAAFENDFEIAKRNLLIAKKSANMKNRAEIILSAFEEFSLFPNGNNLHLKLLLAKSFDQLGFFEMAVLSTKNILKENDKYRDAYIVLGHAYLSLEKFIFAKSAFEKALELDPTKPETAYFLAITENEMKNFTSAAIMMQKAIKNDFSPKVDALKKLGEFNINLGNYQEAENNFEEVLQLSDQNIDNFIQPIWILLDLLKDTKKALALARWSVEKHPQKAMSHNLLGWALLEDKQFTEAKKSLQKSLDLDPNLAAAYLNLGKLFEKLEEPQKAIKNFKKAYQIDPTSAVGNLAAEKFNQLILEQSK